MGSGSRIGHRERRQRRWRDENKIGKEARSRIFAADGIDSLYNLKIVCSMLVMFSDRREGAVKSLWTFLIQTIA
jgi:hypothetical protein